jgi:hypothetical protein
MPELCEREREMQAIDAALAAAGDGRGGAVLVQGPPGSGRTAMLAMAAEGARRAGANVCSWAAGADEADEPLATAQALVAGAATPEALLAAAAGRLLVLVVDDLELADAASRRLLGAAARRATTVPLLLVAATDDGPAGGAVRRSLAGAPITEVFVAALSLAGSTALARAVSPGLDDAACCARHEAAAGLYVAALAAHRAAGAPAPLTRRVGDRLAALGDGPRGLAEALAVLGPDASWSACGRLAGLPGPRRRAGADVLRASGILSRAAEPGFAAPVLAAAVHAATPPGAVASAHRRAAELLAADGAPLERVAAHLMDAEPDGDAWICTTLSAAARAAMEHGAPEAAIALLERALDEPPPPGDRAALLIDLGVAETVAFSTTAAVAHLRDAATGRSPTCWSSP